MRETYQDRRKEVDEEHAEELRQLEVSEREEVSQAAAQFREEQQEEAMARLEVLREQIETTRRQRAERWEQAATEAERGAVLSAFGSNTKVTSLMLSNALLNDHLVANHLGGALATNTALTSLNCESNQISTAGVEALAAALGTNTTLTELKLANQKIAFSQAAEMTLANAVDANRALLSVTVDLRNNRARELIHRALSRNREELRQQRRARTY